MNKNINLLKKSNNIFRYVSIGFILLALGFASDRYFHITPFCLLLSVVIIVGFIIFKSLKK